MNYTNNPLNIRFSESFTWLGQCSHRNGFCEFSKLQFGLRAGLILMMNYRRLYGIDTVDSIIDRFAPSSENNTEYYIHFVCNVADLKRFEHLDSDLKYCRLLHAMCKFESSSTVSVDYIKFVMNYYHIKIVP